MILSKDETCRGPVEAAISPNLILVNVLPAKHGIVLYKNKMICCPNIEFDDKICLFETKFAFFYTRSRNFYGTMHKLKSKLQKINKNRGQKVKFFIYMLCYQNYFFLH
jgi:hypothetical protein